MLKFNDSRPGGFGRVRGFAVLAVVLVLACGDDADISTTTGSDTGGSSTGDSTSSGSTGSTDPTEDASSTAAGETSAETTDATTGGVTTSTSTSPDPDTGSTGSSTGDGGSSSLEEACGSVCERAIVDCDYPFPTGKVDHCTNICVGDYAGEVGACGEAGLDWLDCMATLECGQLANALSFGEPGDCIDAAKAYNAACGQVGAG